MVKMLMMYVICLSRLPGIYLNLSKIVVFLDIYFMVLVHFMLDLMMLHFGVICNSSEHDKNLCPYYASYAQRNFASPMDNTGVVPSLHDSSFLLA